MINIYSTSNQDGAKVLLVKVKDRYLFYERYFADGGYIVVNSNSGAI